MTVWAPGTVAELAAMFGEAAATGVRLEIVGGGTKATIGAPRPEAVRLDMRGFAGIVDYDPAELVLTVGAGTALAEVERLAAAEGQMLAFEPLDHSAFLGDAPGAGTIGGMVAAAAAGPRRLSRGGVRDHMLGFAAVSGRGEAFVAGGKVVKNVTGYDLAKLVTGSWGRLAALTEVTLKVLPAPRESLTCVARGLRVSEARALMARALGSQADVSAAAYLPEGDAAIASTTAFRLEGFGPSIAARAAMLEAIAAPFAALEALSSEEAAAWWNAVRTLAPLRSSRRLWRIVIPSRALAIVAGFLDAASSHWLADWGGGLVWTGHEGDPAALRELVGREGGHAALLKAEEAIRSAVPPLHPGPRAVAALEARVRRAFDPAGLLETGRFLDALDED